MQTDLPIGDVLDQIQDQLAEHDQLILEAPPGAGKTTIVPLSLMDAGWLGYKKILVVEPRRVAAKTAAARMAELLGEQPGGLVGYRMRLESRVSVYTKIEIITEGILARMLQTDPSLEDVGLIIFDEFHERHLDSDLCLSACLKLRQIFRDQSPLKLMVMSATLDAESLTSLLDAPIVISEGKQYPVEVHHGKASQPRERIVDRVVATTRQVLADHPDSSVLVFLPGQGEIHQVFDRLSETVSASDATLHPLYGDLGLDEQQRAIAPVREGRKVVLATNIAETSLTIEGVDVVIDSGLTRVPVFDANTGMTRLQTRKISRASSEQRAGRAGRLRPGHCYRLWSRQQQDQLVNHITPEIAGADLSPLALKLASWGFSGPDDLNWLDKPPAGAWNQAVDLLRQLGAIENGNELALTEHGETMAGIATHPRLAHMLVRGAEANLSESASLLAAVLSDRDPFARGNPDMEHRLAVLFGEVNCPGNRRGWFRRTRKLASQLQRSIGGVSPKFEIPAQATGYLLACAYPDRIARKRHSGAYQLANGRSVTFADKTRMDKHHWLAVAEVGGMAKSKGDRISSAAPLDPELLEAHFPELITETTTAEWDNRAKRFVAAKTRELGALTLKSEQLTDIPGSLRAEAIIAYLEDKGFDQLNWSGDAIQLQARSELLRTFDPAVPNLSEEHLRVTMMQWLAPYLAQVTTLDHLKKLDLVGILKNQLTWVQQQSLDKKVPERFQVPSGSRFKIDYTRSPPVLAVKLQEMFGVTQTPSVCDGQVDLMVHLLSPAGRPLQVTQDLAGFWKTSYADVRKEMKGRYPRHDWPEVPD